MQELADKLSYILDITKQIGSQKNNHKDLYEPLLEIKNQSNGVLSTDNCGYNEFDTNDKETFFKNVSPKIEYLFWLSQNIKDKKIFVRLIDFLSHFEQMKKQFIIQKQDEEQTMLLEHYYR